MARTTPFTRPTLTKNAEIGVRDGSSLRATFAPDGTSATRRLRVQWDELEDAVVYYCGDNQIIYDDAVGYDRQVRINRLIPLAHPAFGNLYAESVSLASGFNAREGGATNAADGSWAQNYKYADIDVMYRARPYVISADNAPLDDQLSEDESLRWCSVGDARMSSDYVMLPNGTLAYIKDGGGGPTGKPIGFNVGKIWPTLEIPIIWNAVPYDLWNPLDNNPSNWFLRVFGGAPLTVSATGGSGNAQLTGIASTQYIEPGQLITGTGVASGSYVATVDSATEITLSKNCTGTVSSVVVNRVSRFGTVNSSQFFGYSPGTLLLSDFRPMQKFNIYGRKEWALEFTFAYDPNRWNFKYFYADRTTATDRGFYFVGAGTTYYAPGSLPDDVSIYNERDHADIFKLGIVPTFVP